MTIQDLLSELTRGFFILLGVLTFLDYLRQRERIKRDVALAVNSISVNMGIVALNDLVPLDARLKVLGTLLIFAQPYLFLQLSNYLQAIPTRTRQVAFIGMITVWILVLLPSDPSKPFLVTVLSVIAYFILINAYVMLRFVKGMQTSSGLLRQRLKLCAIGTGLFALALSFLLPIALNPGLESFLIIPIALASICSAISFIFGFVPPHWLQKIWQFQELRNFLLQIKQKSLTAWMDTSSILRELALAANRITGAKASVVLKKPELGTGWQIFYRSEGFQFDDTPNTINTVLKQLWKKKEISYFSLKSMPASHDLLEGAQAEAMFIVPLLDSEYVLLVFLRQGLFFPDNDRELLGILAQQAETLLENIALLEQLQDYAGSLETKVYERGTALKQSEERYHNIIDNMLESFQIISFDWRYIYVNEAAARYGRTSKNELLGYTVMEKYPGIETSEMFAALKLTMEERLSQHREFKFSYPDGSIGWFEFSIQAVPEGIFILSLDITERKKAEIAMQRLNEELEQHVRERTAHLEALNKELEAFSYSVSHDLRAPLRALDGFSQALLEDYQEKLDEEGQEYLGLIRYESQRMGQLIDDLIGLSRLNRNELHPQSLNLSALVHDIATKLRQRDTQRKVNFIIEDDLIVCADSNLLRIAMQNLLENAWKYSSKKAQAQIEFGCQQASGETLYFVRDNGVGFDMAYVHKLFGAFQRLHGMSEFEGTGIGLATVQRIIHRHGGSIRAEGLVNQGASFYFTLASESC
jgi:PAS domain S-box-containing protein